MSLVRLASLCLLLITLGVPIHAVQAAPPALPCNVSGTVLLNGFNVPVGTTVTAGSDGLVYQTATTTMYEGVSSYSLIIPADNLETAARDGAVEGETIEFTVGGRAAAETVPWASGAVLKLNLTASGPTPTASNTSNATPWPSFTPSMTPVPSPTPSPTEPLEQVVLYSTSDTHINSWYPSNNHDASQYVTVRQGDVIASLLHFDVASIAGREVRSARLELYATKRSNSAALTISAYRVLRAWVGKQATWAQASTGVPWSLAGCNGQGADREAAATNTFLADAASRWYSLDVTALARVWAADPAQNQGLVLKGSGGTSVEYNLASKESPDASLRPRLVVQLALGPATTATPAPSQTPTRTALPTALATFTSTPAPTGSPTPTRTAPPTNTATSAIVPTATPTSQPSPAPSSTLSQPVEQVVYYPTSDTHINSWYPSTNYDASQYVNVRQGDVIAALLRFDVPDLAGRDIRSARLELNASKRTNTSALTVSAYRVLRTWVSKQATWAQASSGIAWDRPGCNGEGADREAAVASTLLLDAVGRSYSMDITAMVRAWAANPAQNQGMVLKGSGGASVEYNLASKESPDASLRPRLVVEVAAGPTATATTAPDHTPTPSRTATLPVVSATPTSAPPTNTMTPTLSQPSITPASTASPSPAPPVDQAVLYPTSDTYINSWYPSTNYDASQYVNVRQGDVMAALLRFDTSSLNGREIVSARLELNSGKRSNTAALTVSAYRVLRPWVGKQATWAQASTGVPWDRPGCNGEGTDREAAASATVLVDAVLKSYSLDVTAMVRAWAADAAQNQGLVLKGSGGASVEYDFASKEAADIVVRPRLVVDLAAMPAPEE